MCLTLTDEQLAEKLQVTPRWIADQARRHDDPLPRFRESVVLNGELKNIQRARKIATLTDYPPKRRGGVPDAVKQLAREFLDSVNDTRRQPEQVRKVGDFVESVYFPLASEQL